MARGNDPELAFLLRGARGHAVYAALRRKPASALAQLLASCETEGERLAAEEEARARAEEERAAGCMDEGCGGMGDLLAAYGDSESESDGDGDDEAAACGGRAGCGAAGPEEAPTGQRGRRARASRWDVKEPVQAASVAVRSHQEGAERRVGSRWDRGPTKRQRPAPEAESGSSDAPAAAGGDEDEEAKRARRRARALQLRRHFELRAQVAEVEVGRR